MDIKYFLKNLPAFEEFSERQIEALAARLQLAGHEDGHVFMRQGEQGDALYLLLRGQAHLCHQNGGTGQTVRELADGEMFGILSLVENMPSLSTCVAKGAGETASLSPAAYQALFAEAPPVARHLQYMVAVQMARELQDANRRERLALGD